MNRVLRLLHRERNTVVQAPVPRSQDIGVLGLDSHVRGNVRFQGTLTVDGTVSGDVRAPEGSGAMLIVGQSATVQGDIVSDAVLISGRVNGNVKARQRVEIFGTGILHGDIETGDIMIQGGAEFQGRCHMLKQAPVVSAEIEGVAAPKGRDLGGHGRRKGKGGKPDRADATADASSASVGNGSEGVAVQQDSRTEHGSTTEGHSA